MQRLKYILLPKEIHTNATSIELSSLKASSLYRVLVTVSGEHGTSLPSSMLVVNTSTSLDALSE